MLRNFTISSGIHIGKKHRIDTLYFAITHCCFGLFEVGGLPLWPTRPSYDFKSCWNESRFGYPYPTPNISSVSLIGKVYLRTYLVVNILTYLLYWAWYSLSSLIPIWIHDSIVNHQLLLTTGTATLVPLADHVLKYRKDWLTCPIILHKCSSTMYLGIQWVICLSNISIRKPEFY